MLKRYHLAILQFTVSQLRWPDDGQTDSAAFWQEKLHQFLFWIISVLQMFTSHHLNNRGLIPQFIWKMGVDTQWLYLSSKRLFWHCSRSAACDVATVAWGDHADSTSPLQHCSLSADKIDGLKSGQKRWANLWLQNCINSIVIANFLGSCRWLFHYHLDEKHSHLKIYAIKVMNVLTTKQIVSALC